MGVIDFKGECFRKGIIVFISLGLVTCLFVGYGSFSEVSGRC